MALQLSAAGGMATSSWPCLGEAGHTRSQGHAPQEFVERLEYVDWEGMYKDLAFVPDAAVSEVMLIDDDEGWILPEQKGQWLGISEWDPYLAQGQDRELSRLEQVLRARLRCSGNGSA